MAVERWEEMGTFTSGPSTPCAVTALLYDTPSTCTAFLPSTTTNHPDDTGEYVSATCTRDTVLLSPSEKKDEGDDACARLSSTAEEERDRVEEERGGEEGV